MPSQRNTIKSNVNNSKNTRMEMDASFANFDFRKDEIMHLGRYNNSANTMIQLSKQLKRPIRVLDIGCGEINTVRLFYKSTMEKKSDIVERYVGVDIDDIMIDKAKKKYGRVYESCNAEFLNTDLTVNPHLDFDDGYFDLIVCFEFLEHINPKFSQAILDEAYRLLNKDTGIALFSTPNSNGSNKQLPKDHFYEYSYEELIEKFEEANFTVENSVGCCINVSRIPSEVMKSAKPLFDRIYAAYGTNSAFSSVAIAPLLPPTYCKNVLYTLTANK